MSETKEEYKKRLRQDEELVERVAQIIHPQAWNDWQYREPNRTEWKQWARRTARKVIAEVRSSV